MARKVEAVQDSFYVLALSNYVKPEVIELKNDNYALNGFQNSFFQYVIDRYNGSPTNSAIINSYIERIYGKGLTVENEEVNISQKAALSQVLSDKEVRKLVSDFKLFGSCVGQVVYSMAGNRKVQSIKHLDRQMVAPSLLDPFGRVNSYYVCQDWKNSNKFNPVGYPAFGTSEEPIEIFEIKPYRAGKVYFADPDYLPALQYAFLEEEISNFSISHIQNGLSAGVVINFNNGVPTEEMQEQIKRRVLANLAGSSNAGKIIFSFNENKELAPTVEAIPTNANHEQWQFWASEARQQIMVGHRVTTPMLFGVKDNSGLGNNAQEMLEGSKILHETIIVPFQNEILDVLQNIVALNGITVPLVFKNLDIQLNSIKPAAAFPVAMAKGSDALSRCADYLISVGEDEENTYEVINIKKANREDVSEKILNYAVKMASVPSGDSRKNSAHDTSLFKVRYRYAGAEDGERDFCAKIINSGKVFRYEDLIAAQEQVVNQGFGPYGSDTYDIFKYKGGVNCKHFWERVIYLKKGNSQITVNEAKKMILALEPEDRDPARWPNNPKEVAQSASELNNYWRVQ